MTDNAPLLAVALPLVKREESCRLVAYPDPLTGKEPWTVGWGQTGPNVGPETAISQAQADSWLLSKVLSVIGDLDREHPWWRSLNLPRQAVLVSMAYQMGEAGLDGFKNTLAAIEGGYYALASAKMLMSAWAKQTPNRAAREAAIMKSGVIA